MAFVYTPPSGQGGLTNPMDFLTDSLAFYGENNVGRWAIAAQAVPGNSDCTIDLTIDNFVADFTPGFEIGLDPSGAPIAKFSNKNFVTNETFEIDLIEQWVLDEINEKGLGDAADYSANKTAFSYVTKQMLGTPPSTVVDSEYWDPGQDSDIQIGTAATGGTGLQVFRVTGQINVTGLDVASIVTVVLTYTDNNNNAQSVTLATVASPDTIVDFGINTIACAVGGIIAVNVATSPPTTSTWGAVSIIEQMNILTEG